MPDVLNPLKAERTVLFVSLKSDPLSVDGLVMAGWHVVHAKAAPQVERLLERGAVRVGVVSLPPDVTDDQLAELESCVCHTEAAWVALVRRGQADLP